MVTLTIIIIGCILMFFGGYVINSLVTEYYKSTGGFKNIFYELMFAIIGIVSIVIIVIGTTCVAYGTYKTIDFISTVQISVINKTL